MAATTNVWSDVTGGNAPNWGQGIWVGLYWDEPTGRLWTTEGIDYPDDVQARYTGAILTRKLNPDGTVREVRGYFGLEGIGQRRLYGGACLIPRWFQERFGVGPFGVGFGGYASRMAAGVGGGVSLGPTLYTVPDPARFANGTNFTPSQFKTLMDCGPATGEDWYAMRVPRSFDRGVRNTDVVNYFDSGDPRPNPTTPPPGPPSRSARWLSPAPDGLGRWVWGDSAWNTGCWIDGPAKQGFVLCPTFNSGKVYYASSTLHAERRTFEIQVFDPAQFGEVVRGRRKPWAVRPTAHWQIRPPGLYSTTPGDISGGGPWGSIAGATYDAQTRRLYLYGVWLSRPEFSSRIYVYSVGA